jgi:hypothetical protein
LEELPEEYTTQAFRPAGNIGRARALHCDPDFNQDTGDCNFDQEPSFMASRSSHEPSSRSPSFKTGQRVRHPTFGEGIIRKTEGKHGEQRLLIQFRGGELKRLSANQANLVTL